MMKVQTAVKQMATPTSEYQTLSVRVLYKTEDYLKARQKLALAEMTSDLQTEAEEDSQSLLQKRKKRPNPRFQDDDDDETEDDDIPAPRKKSPRKGIPKRHLPPLPPLPTLPPVASTSRELSPSPERRQSPRKMHKTPPMPTLMDRCTKTPMSDKRSSQPTSIDLKILASIEGLKCDVKTELRQNTQLLQAILKRMDSNVASSEPCDFEEETFPISSKTQLDRLELKLKDNEVFNKLVRNLGTIGGENVKSATRRILAHLFTNDFARTINWMGKGDKIGFSKLRIRDVVAKSVRKNRLTLSATDSEINSVAKDWFRFAPDREGGRKQREEKKREEKKKEE